LIHLFLRQKREGSALFSRCRSAGETEKREDISFRAVSRDRKTAGRSYFKKRDSLFVPVFFFGNKEGKQPPQVRL
jgi:hypothetical protein